MLQKLSMAFQNVHGFPKLTKVTGKVTPKQIRSFQLFPEPKRTRAEPRLPRRARSKPSRNFCDHWCGPSFIQRKTEGQSIPFRHYVYIYIHIYYNIYTKGGWPPKKPLTVVRVCCLKGTRLTDADVFSFP